MTVGEFLDRWLTGSAKTIVKPTTFVNYEGVIKNHIKPHLGGVPLMKLAVIHIQGLYSAMARDGKSAETIRLTHAVLRRALKQGVRWRLIPYNVCADVDRPRVAKAEIAPLNIEQVAKFLKVVEQDRHSAVFTLAIAAGMRSGELFGLQWHDVDLKAGAIMVTHTLTELHGKWFLTEPKTAKGRRRINLPAMAIEALKKHRSQMLTEGHGNVPWVFCDTQGGPLRRSHFRERVFKPLLKKAGLPNIRFHDLRQRNGRGTPNSRPRGHTLRSCLAIGLSLAHSMPAITGKTVSPRDTSRPKVWLLARITKRLQNFGLTSLDSFSSTWLLSHCCRRMHHRWQERRQESER
jgi:integrase